METSHVLIAIGIAILFFIIGRELICWYFKINKIVGLLQSINDSLQKNSKDNNDITTKV